MAEPSLRELRELVAEFEPNRGHVLPALHKIQKRYGYVPRRAIDALARQLNTTAALLYGSVTFYSDFRTTPPPPRRIDWCSGPACRLAGGDRIREAIENDLRVPLGGDTSDGRVTFQVGQCNGTCTEAPQLWVDHKVVGNLTVASAIRLARQVRDEG